MNQSAFFTGRSQDGLMTSRAPAPLAANPRNCIAMLCDRGYLFPTLVCAGQARAHAPRDTDVMLFLDDPEFSTELASDLERLTGARIRPVPADYTRLLDEAIPDGFFKTHVNRAALFRLFVGELAGAQYHRILYLDGDIQVRASLAPLLGMPLADGGVAAVRDWLALHKAHDLPIPPESQQYLDGLGLTPTEQGGYINSGVMLASPATWNALGRDALAFLARHPERCRFHDQSALNVVGRARFEYAPVRWNFLRQYMALPAYRAVDPAVLHFVGRLKPWDGAYPPWGRREFEPYKRMARDVEPLGVRWPRRSLLRRAAYKLRPWMVRDEYADAGYAAAIDRAVAAENSVSARQPAREPPGFVRTAPRAAGRSCTELQGF